MADAGDLLHTQVIGRTSMATGIIRIMALHGTAMNNGPLTHTTMEIGFTPLVTDGFGFQEIIGMRIAFSGPMAEDTLVGDRCSPVDIVITTMVMVTTTMDMAVVTETISTSGSSSMPTVSVIEAIVITRTAPPLFATCSSDACSEIVTIESTGESWNALFASPSGPSLGVP